MNIIVRRAKSSDAVALVELNEEFNRFRMPLAVVRKCLTANVKEAVFLAEANGKAAGYACVQRSRSFCYVHPWAEVTEMYVRREYRRKGIGTALLRAAEEHARRRGVNLIQVLTGEKNRRGQGLYAAAGYLREKKYVYIKKLAIVKGKA